MRIELGPIPDETKRWLPESEPDASGVGVNYADACLKLFKRNLEDGRKMIAKRRGLKVTLKIGERSGSALLDRLAHGPEVGEILHHALVEAAAGAGAAFSVEGDLLILDLD
jgi:hypothetical protein